MASFDEKVEALRKLRDRREARNAANAVNAANAAALEPAPAFSPPTRAAAANTTQVENTMVRPTIGGVEQEVTESEPKKDFDAFFCAGHCSEYGLHGCTKDVPVAAEMYRIAAEGGHIIAQWRYGDLLESGLDGVQQDEEAAVMWYRRAADAGNAHAQSNLALMLEEGRGVEQDDVAGFRWHMLAAEQGNALSQYCAAVCLEEGRGTSQDVEQARELMRQSADAGFGPARSALALVVTTTRREIPSEPEGEPEGKSEADASLLGLAARIARHLEGMDDEEAGGILDELLAEVPSLLDQGSASDSEEEDEDEQFNALRTAMQSPFGDQQQLLHAS